MTAYYATRGFVLHKSRKDRKSRVVQTELQDCATKSRNREVDSKIVRRLHTLDGALAYTGRHVEGIRRSAEAIGPYRGVGLPGCGRYVGRRVPCFGAPAHPCVGGFRFGHADSVGAYARVGFPGIVDRAYVDQPYGWFHHDARRAISPVFFRRMVSNLRKVRFTWWSSRIRERATSIESPMWRAS